MQLRAFHYAIIVALGGFVFGLDTAVISGTVKFITAEFDIYRYEQWQLSQMGFWDIFLFNAVSTVIAIFILNR